MAFTGHRPSKLGGYDPTVGQPLHVWELLEKVILESIELGFTQFISGMAIGVDTWAAQIVLQEKVNHPDIKLILAIPFKGQEARWNAPTRNIYHDIVSNADRVVVVEEGGYEAWKMQTRNVWMVNNSFKLIAVWDGTTGGTGNCVKYAKKHGNEIVFLDPQRLLDRGFIRTKLGVWFDMKEICPECQATEGQCSYVDPIGDRRYPKGWIHSARLIDPSKIINQ